jgi:hypothetical protein
MSRRSARDPAARVEGSDEMVPPAVEANLDDVASELIDASAKLPEFIRPARPAVRALQFFAVGVEHEPQTFASAYGALVARGLSDVLGRADKFGMCVAHVDPGNKAASQLSQQRPLPHPVVDGGHGSGIVRPGSDTP